MKITTPKCIVILLLLAIFSPACEVTVGDDNPTGNVIVELDDMDTTGRVFSEVEFRGSGFGDDCVGKSVVFSSGFSSQQIAVQSCSDNSIIAFIPDTMEPGNYAVTLNVDHVSFSALNGTDLEVEVIARPVILTMTPTQVAPGGTVSVTGRYFLNPTNISVYDPAAWITQVGYSNTVSDVTVNADGTAATIIISDNLAPGAGVYQFKMVAEEFGNEVDLTIL